VAQVVMEAQAAMEPQVDVEEKDAPNVATMETAMELQPVEGIAEGLIGLHVETMTSMEDLLALEILHMEVVVPTRNNNHPPGLPMLRVEHMVVAMMITAELLIPLVRMLAVLETRVSSTTS